MRILPSPRTRVQWRRLARRLEQDCSGLALVEFAFAAPLVLSMGMMGTETASLTIAHMQVSQIAMQVADNTSRIGEQDVLTARKVYESDVSEALVGAEKLGQGMDFYERGRVIVSSLQLNAQNGQWIAWQRCRGAKRYDSSYGVEGNGASGTGFPGMGEPGRYITASSGTAVMFVEVAYNFDAPTPLSLFDGQEITYTAAFNVRDNRDLTRLYSGGPVARCTTYSAARPT
jgi:hypothetical protein